MSTQAGFFDLMFEFGCQAFLFLALGVCALGGIGYAVTGMILMVLKNPTGKRYFWISGAVSGIGASGVYTFIGANGVHTLLPSSPLWFLVLAVLVTIAVWIFSAVLGLVLARFEAIRREIAVRVAAKEL